MIITFWKKEFPILLSITTFVRFVAWGAGSYISLFIKSVFPFIIQVLSSESNFQFILKSFGDGEASFEVIKICLVLHSLFLTAICVFVIIF